jgi:molecular chaperone HtpG
MQDRSLVEKLNRVLTKRFIKFLDEEAKNRPEEYAQFYKEFGIFLKEGAALDFAHKDALMKLLRFESSLTEAGKSTTFADYVSRMGAEQKEIFYVVGPNRAAIEAGPYLEGFRARNIEVLFCFETVDEYVMGNVREFDGRKITAADHADVKLSEQPRAEGALGEDEVKALSGWLKDTLGERVADVRASERLVDSPAMALNADKLGSPHMRRLMRALNKDGAESPLRVNLEINPRHALIKRLAQLRASEPQKAALVAQQVLDNALISAGLLDDAPAMVKRLYKLLESV